MPADVDAPGEPFTGSVDLPRRLVQVVSSFVEGHGPIRATALTALLLPVIALAAVIVADLVPDRLIMDHLYEATVSGDLDAASYDVGYAGNLVDGYSECKRITIGLGNTPGTGVIDSAIRSPTLGPCENAVPKIVGWAEGEGLERQYYYTQYWNGSAVVFRPSIAALGVSGSRMVAAFAVLTSVAFFAWRARARVGGLTTAFLVTPIVATTDLIDLPGALLHSLAWTLLFVAAGLLLDVPARASLAIVAWWSFTAGAVFLFFADMTNPEAAWTLASASVSLGAVHVVTTAELAGRTVVGAAGWILGYAWMWVSKWVIGAFVWGLDVMWDNVVGQIEVRLDGEYQGIDPDVWTGVERVSDAWWGVPLTPLLAPVAALAAVVVFVRRRRAPGLPDGRGRAIVAGAAAIPLVWYAVLRNHTYLHAWFVYRSLPVAFGVVLVAVVLDPARGRLGDGSGAEPLEGADSSDRVG